MATFEKGLSVATNTFFIFLFFGLVKILNKLQGCELCKNNHKQKFKGEECKKTNFPSNHSFSILM